MPGGYGVAGFPDFPSIGDGSSWPGIIGPGIMLPGIVGAGSSGARITGAGGIWTGAEIKSESITICRHYSWRLSKDYICNNPCILLSWGNYVLTLPKKDVH